MDQPFRARRSVLYMPGSNERALEKARSLPADCLIFDLEDAVAPEAKAAARSQVAAAVRAGGYGDREVIVRTNGVATQWFAEDIAAIAAARPDGILLPKIEKATEVDEALRQLTIAGAPELPLWIMTETPAGVLALQDILAAQPQVQVVVMGTSDLAKEMRVDPLGTRPGLAHALGQCVLAARAQVVDIIDGVYLALDDQPGFESACEQGRALGFDGKSLIHPRQIEIANACFGVSDEAVAEARELMAAWQEARARGDGITVLNGQLVEQLHVDEAERTIALYEAATR